MKKDPGRFTVRFNLKRPRDLQAVEILNQQSSVSQFLIDAIISYSSAQCFDRTTIKAIMEEVFRENVSITHVMKKSEQLNDSPPDGQEEDMILDSLKQFGL